MPKDGKQIVMFSPKDPIAPILKKCQDENLDILQTLDAKSESLEKDESETIFTDSSVGDRIDTMVSRSDNEEEIEEIMRPRAEETVKTFLTEGKLNRDDSADFYDVNDSKGIVKVNKESASRRRNGRKKSDDAMEVDSLGEEQLHEKLDEMIEKRNRKDKGKGKANVEKENENIQQLQLEKSVEKMSIVAKESQMKSPELDDEAKKRRLLLAKIQAIDNGENPNDVTSSYIESRKIGEKKSRPYKKPIFLESSPRSSTNTSDDDLASVKSLDTYSGNNSKANSANSTSRRNRPFPDSHSGNETDSPVKTKARTDSLELKNTDNNLNKGHPAYADTITSTNQILPPPVRNNDRSLTGSLGYPNSNAVNGNKNRINTNKSDNNAHGRFDTNYSPTASDINTGQNRKTGKKNTFDLFDQFEDPFKYSSTNRNDNEDSNPIKFKNASSGNQPGKKQDHAGELFAKTNKGAQTPDSTVLDDLEEMFIL